MVILKEELRLLNFYWDNSRTAKILQIPIERPSLLFPENHNMEIHLSLEMHASNYYCEQRMPKIR